MLLTNAVWHHRAHPRRPFQHLRVETDLYQIRQPVQRPKRKVLYTLYN